ncbi:34204_t:CDS:2 [Racocetra persica]|uniref:34204_t:CDS:1 n=1 Tax=Racocetra persica TaxID=160502 RepID=A0ACA9QR70_9GLOM|nr:34204_t:CDS:2 [Racocetra persica]
MNSSAPKAIEVINLTKFYGNKKVLDQVSFAVRPGTIHGFIGPNGAGKSTTLGILVGLVLPSYGNAYIEGRSVTNDPYFNEHLGSVVPAEVKFPPDFAVEKYVGVCSYLRDVPLDQAEERFAASPLFQFAAQKFRDLKKFREAGGTVLISTHILSDLQELADDITMIRNGRIVYTGPKTDNIVKTYEEYFLNDEKNREGLFAEKANQQLEKELRVFVGKLEKIRSNQISLEMIRGLTINYQGERKPLKTLANFRISPSNELVIQTFESKFVSLIIEVVKQQGYKLAGSTKKEAYFTLSSSGETREKLIRDVKVITEEGKTAFRLVRQDIRKEISSSINSKSSKKGTNLFTDQKRKYEIQMDELIKNYQQKLIHAKAKKIQELEKV